MNMLCDIGNGTMNIMFINDRKPILDRMFTEKYGTINVCWPSGENVMRTHHATVDDAIINRVLPVRHGGHPGGLSDHHP